MKINTLICTLLIGFSLHAQNFNKAKMDSLFNIIEENDKGMGSISIFHDGKEVYKKSYGYLDLENKIKANSTTKYRIGSISKTFTATIVMKLIEEGKLSLSTGLNRYYPQVKNADKITIEQLLQHRSGIFNITNNNYINWNTQRHSKQQLLDKIVAGGNTFEPGEKFEYSNSNYILLTFITEDITGKSFSDLLQEIIIKPCGLKNTYPGGKINPKNNEALSYMRLSAWKPENETDLSIPLGAGSLVSTPTDLNTFFTNLFNGKILKKESLDLMCNIKDGFGFGLVQVPFYNKKGYGHTGGLDGFQSNAFYFPDDKVSIALTSNAVSYLLNDIILGALSIYFGMEYTLPEFKEIVSITSLELDKYLGVYSGPGFPIKLTISKDKNTLIGQGTGQPSFPLEYIGNNKFKFDQAKLEIEFLPKENKMILIQFGGKFELTRIQNP